MLQYLKNEANLTHTENGAVTYQSTQSECLDLFATIGALRRESDEEITNRFLRAYAENADLAMKTLFFARDIRGGIGERRVFRTILRWLAHNEPQSVEKNIPYIAEYPQLNIFGVLRLHVLASWHPFYCLPLLESVTNSLLSILIFCFASQMQDLLLCDI